MGRQYRVCSLFSGAGGIDIAFKQAGCRVVWANENDRDACLTYHLNFPDIPLDCRDIREVPAEIIPEFDILVGGFPCQPFSSVGREEGFKDKRGNMFFEICRIIDKKRPKALFLENVANLETHDNGKTFDIIKEQLMSRGYHFSWLVADAQDYGFPQRRNRIYIVCFSDSIMQEHFSFPLKSKPNKHIFDIIDKTVKAPDWCYLKPGTDQYDKMNRAITNDDEMYRFSDGKYAARGGILSSRRGIAFTLLAGMGNWHDREPVIRDLYGIRKLTPYECFMLQGYPPSFSLDGIPVKSAYRQAGNTVCVPVVSQFAKEITAALKAAEEKREEETSVLVGTLRDKRQLDISLKEHFYHFPAYFLPDDISRIRWVALYVPPRVSGEKTGIRYIGRIKQCKIIPRNEIIELPKKSTELYCRINVEEWKKYTGDFQVQMKKPVICIQCKGQPESKPLV